MTEQEKQIRHEKVNELAKIISLNPKFCKSRGDCYECPIFKKNTCDYVASAQELYDLGYRKGKRGEWIKKHRHRGGFETYTGVDKWGETHTITIDTRCEYDELYCSVCGKLASDVSLNYCSYCGASMTRGKMNE